MPSLSNYRDADLKRSLFHLLGSTGIATGALAFSASQLHNIDDLDDTTTASLLTASVLCSRIRPVFHYWCSSDKPLKSLLHNGDNGAYAGLVEATVTEHGYAARVVDAVGGTVSVLLVPYTPCQCVKELLVRRYATTIFSTVRQVTAGAHPIEYIGINKQSGLTSLRDHRPGMPDSLEEWFEDGVRPPHAHQWSQLFFMSSECSLSTTHTLRYRNTFLESTANGDGSVSITYSDLSSLVAMGYLEARTLVSKMHKARMKRVSNFLSLEA